MTSFYFAKYSNVQTLSCIHFPIGTRDKKISILLVKFLSQDIFEKKVMVFYILIVRKNIPRNIKEKSHFGSIGIVVLH